MQSIEKRVQAVGGRPTGFDYLRISLAIAITAHHGIGMSYGWAEQMKPGPFDPFVLTWLAAFFALSGYLVAGSLDRTKSIITFLGLRGLRIFPALIVDTLFSALVLGTVFTTLPLKEYFSSPVLHSYFLNMVGDVHFYLPGVFESNPYTKVNGQLWSIPWELECYFALTVMAIIGFYQRRSMLVAALVAAQLVLVLNDIVRHPPDDFGVSGRNLVLCFLAGVTIHQFRERIPYSFFAFTAAILWLAMLHVFPSLTYLLAFPMAYITVYLGLLNPRKIRLLETGDYSYGVFLYGSPIQQAVVAAFPFVKGNWWFEYPISLPFILLFAVLSWHLVEKHALRQKKRLYAAEPYWILLQNRAVSLLRIQRIKSLRESMVRRA